MDMRWHEMAVGCVDFVGDVKEMVRDAPRFNFLKDRKVDELS